MTTIHFLMKYTSLCPDVIGIIDSYDFNECITEFNSVIEELDEYINEYTQPRYRINTGMLSIRITKEMVKYIILAKIKKKINKKV